MYPNILDTLTPDSPADYLKLTSLNKEDSLQCRSFELTEHKSMPIGRSTKNVNKGFQSSDDNLWIDSPVLSRQHAEIYATDSGKVGRYSIYHSVTALILETGHDQGQKVDAWNKT